MPKSSPSKEISDLFDSAAINHPRTNNKTAFLNVRFSVNVLKANRNKLQELLGRLEDAGFRTSLLMTGKNRGDVTAYHKLLLMGRTLHLVSFSDEDWSDGSPRNVPNHLVMVCG